MKLLGRDGVSRPLRLQAWLLYLRGRFQGGRPAGRLAGCRVCTEAQPGTKDATWFLPSCSESTVYLVTHLECWAEATTSKGHFLSRAPAGAPILPVGCLCGLLGSPRTRASGSVPAAAAAARALPGLLYRKPLVPRGRRTSGSDFCPHHHPAGPCPPC